MKNQNVILLSKKIIESFGVPFLKKEFVVGASTVYAWRRRGMTMTQIQMLHYKYPNSAVWMEDCAKAAFQTIA